MNQYQEAAFTCCTCVSFDFQFKKKTLNTLNKDGSIGLCDLVSNTATDWWNVKNTVLNLKRVMYKMKINKSKLVVITLIQSFEFQCRYPYP